MQRGGVSVSVDPSICRGQRERSPMESESEQGEMERQQEEEDLVRLLPDDALAVVLGRLAPRDLAVSRCVRRSWRAVVDARRLLLPHQVGGIFIEFRNIYYLDFFARPTTGTTVSGKLDFLPPGAGCFVQDHCNGLFLCDECVFNPATRRCAPLPSRPPPRMMTKYFYQNRYLVFDPTVSLHYEVFIIPRIMYDSRPGDFTYCYIGHELDPAIEESEWPPSPFILLVFSSKTRQWEERTFLREGKAVGTVGDMRKAVLTAQKRYATYWQGELYVHCESDFVIRISLSNHKYQIIKPPIGVEESNSRRLYLGKSEKGVYCALVDNLDESCQLRVWILKELNGHMEWVLMHQTNLVPILARQNQDRQTNGPWNYRRRYGIKDNDEAIVQEKFEWDSDNDNVLETEDAAGEYYKYIDFLGFHPYKEVVFLGERFGRGLAYHLNSSKVQELGNLYPKNYGHVIRESFPYTPCWLGECP